MFCYRLMENMQLGGFVRFAKPPVPFFGSLRVSGKACANPRNQRCHKKIRWASVVTHTDRQTTKPIDTMMENMSDLEADMDFDDFVTDMQPLDAAHESEDVEVNTGRDGTETS